MPKACATLVNTGAGASGDASSQSSSRRSPKSGPETRSETHQAWQIWPNSGRPKPAKFGRSWANPAQIRNKFGRSLTTRARHRQETGPMRPILATFGLKFGLCALGECGQGARPNLVKFRPNLGHPCRRNENCPGTLIEHRGVQEQTSRAGSPRALVGTSPALPTNTKPDKHVVVSRCSSLAGLSQGGLVNCHATSSQRRWSRLQRELVDA